MLQVHMIIWNLDYLSNVEWAIMSCCSKRHLLQSSPPGPMLWSSSWASSAQQRQSEIVFQLFNMLCFYIVFPIFFPSDKIVNLVVTTYSRFDLGLDFVPSRYNFGLWITQVWSHTHIFSVCQLTSDCFLWPSKRFPEQAIVSLVGATYILLS